MLFSTVNTALTPRRASKRGAFNLGVHHLSALLTNKFRQARRRGTRSEGGGETRAERKRKTEKGRGDSGESGMRAGGGDGGVGRSEKIGKVTEEQRRREIEKDGAEEGGLSPY